MLKKNPEGGKIFNSRLIMAEQFFDRMATKFIASRVPYIFPEDKHIEIQMALAYLTNCDVKISNLRAEDRFSHKQFVARTRSRSFEKRCTNAQRVRMCRLRHKNGNDITRPAENFVHSSDEEIEFSEAEANEELRKLSDDENNDSEHLINQIREHEEVQRRLNGESSQENQNYQIEAVNGPDTD